MSNSAQLDGQSGQSNGHSAAQSSSATINQNALNYVAHYEQARSQMNPPLNFSRQDSPDKRGTKRSHASSVMSTDESNQPQYIKYPVHRNIEVQSICQSTTYNRLQEDPHYDWETGSIDPDLIPGWDKECSAIATLDEQPLAPFVQDEQPSDSDASSYSYPPWADYKPKLLTTYSQSKGFKPFRKRQIESLVDDVQIPGKPTMFKRPKLPVHFPAPTIKINQQVCKAPLIATIMIAELAGVKLLPETMNSVETETKQEPSSESLSADKETKESITQSNNNITFVGARNSLRALLDSRSHGWRCDIQRSGDCIYLRRHLGYGFEDANDIGHLFEKACSADQGESDRAFRCVIEGHVGEFKLLTTSEVDLAAPHADNRPFELNDIIELKTTLHITGQAYNNRLKTYWFQSFIGGVGEIMVGHKKTNEDESTDIVEIRSMTVPSCMTDDQKQRTFHRLHQVLSFIMSNVQEGKMYKLHRERGQLITLDEIVDGIKTNPIVDHATIRTVKQWVEQTQISNNQSASPVGEDCNFKQWDLGQIKSSKKQRVQSDA